MARPGAPMIFLEHVRSNLPPVVAVQWLLNLVTVPTQNDHWDRRTPDLVRAAASGSARSGAGCSASSTC